MLQDLPKVSSATDAEVLYCIEQHQLMGRGIGHIDAHLMAATALTSPTRLYRPKTNACVPLLLP
jgi:hypothetical protein